jgi:hypothetical protein
MPGARLAEVGRSSDEEYAEGIAEGGAGLFERVELEWLGAGLFVRGVGVAMFRRVLSRPAEDTAA